MEQKIIQLIKEYDLLAPRDRVLVAVSGGPDSMALLHWLASIKEEWQLSLMAVHLNHQFRGEDADADERYVEAICAEWGIPCLSKSMDVANFAYKHKLGKQEAARECRYQFFEEVARKYAYTKVALGHHADDQLETVLMRLIRGAGLAGLSGIPLVRETDHYTIIRPLLAVMKEEIEAYCSRYKLDPRRDASNESDQYTRNYIRHHLIPHVVHLNHNVHQIVTEMTATLQLENEYIEKECQQYLQEVVLAQTEEEITISLPSFLEAPLPLQRRLILLLLSYLPISRNNWNKIHIDSILNLFYSGNGYKQLNLPEQVLVSKEYHQVKIGRIDYSKGNQATEYQLEIPSLGEYTLSAPALKLKLTTVEREVTAEYPVQERVKKAANMYIAWFDQEQLHFPLMLRNRRPGDKIQPLGMEGRQKVKDIFINEKIPHALREKWPLLTNQESVIWLPGLKRSNQAKVTARTKHILKVEIEIFEEDLLRAR